MENSTKHIADMKEHFKEQQRLLTSMDLLHKEVHFSFHETFLLLRMISKEVPDAILGLTGAKEKRVKSTEAEFDCKRPHKCD